MTQPPESQKPATHRRQPLARGVELITTMVDSGQQTFGVRELASNLNVSPSTAHRLITDLEALDLVSRTPGGTYRLGLEFLRLAWSTSAKYPLHEASESILQHLTRTTGETAFYGTFSATRQRMMFTRTSESLHPLRYVIPVNEWLPLHIGASGLAILAFMPPEAQEEVIRAAQAADDAETMRSRLAQIKNQGYAITHGERIDGAVAIAAPVFSPTGIAGVVGISLPDVRFNAADLEKTSALVKTSAAQLTEFLEVGK